MTNGSSSDAIPAPGFVVPGARTALEMALVGLLIGLVGLPAKNALYLGVVALAALVAMTVVLFWSLNRQIRKWIRRAQGKPTMADGSDVR
ncbi:hypothetical protein [Halomicrobium salinisoli]|uniref:hypothetical protein n=1 Tax=Halomicrobium salinisoli TaxID=2878391 RepID=UPI001CF0663D|nr:hypothetical protein [Halomicrobium salinisoli]